MLSFSRRLPLLKSSSIWWFSWVYLKADTISRPYRLPEKCLYSVLTVLTIGPYLELPDPNLRWYGCYLEHCDPKFDLKINIGHYDLYFMVQWFCLISWRLFDAWTLLFGIMSQSDPKFYLKIHVGHCDLYFMAQWFCVICWRLFYVWTLYLGIKGQYDLTFDLKINVGLCDLYFMVQWLCLIAPGLFDTWVSYFQIMRQCDPNFDLKVNISQHDLYFMV